MNISELKICHIFGVPGCGNGIVTRSIVKAIDNLGLNKVIFV